MVNFYHLVRIEHPQQVRAIPCADTSHYGCKSPVYLLSRIVTIMVKATISQQGAVKPSQEFATTHALHDLH